MKELPTKKRKDVEVHFMFFFSVSYMFRENKNQLSWIRSYYPYFGGHMQTRDNVKIGLKHAKKFWLWNILLVRSEDTCIHNRLRWHISITLVLSMSKKVVSRTKRIGQGVSSAYKKSSPFYVLTFCLCFCLLKQKQTL